MQEVHCLSYYFSLRLATEFPEVKIVTVAIDEKLNDSKFIVPGLGDAGDLAYGEKV